MTGPLIAMAASALSALVLLSAIWVVTLRNLFRAALSLGLVLVGVAGLFLVLEAEFIAFVQILVYVGAILILVVFAIMLTARLHGSSVASPSRQRLPAAAASLALFFLLVGFTQNFVPSVAATPKAVSLAQLGQELVTTLMLPFEVISLLFVAAMVGAIVVASSNAPSTSASAGSLPTEPSRHPSTTSGAA